MKKREIHAQDFIIAQVIIHLETILRGADRFLCYIKVEKFGSVDVFQVDAPRGEAQIVQLRIKPRWWPEGSTLWIDYSERDRTFSNTISFFVPLLQFGFVSFPLVLVSSPPFFEPDTYGTKALFFKQLCEKAYGIRTAAV